MFTDQFLYTADIVQALDMIKVCKDPSPLDDLVVVEKESPVKANKRPTTQDHKMCSRGTSLAAQWLRLVLPLWRSGNQDPQFCVV